MKTIAIMNNKGGVGKTVTAINLADILVADYAQRVVLVDCDGQANLTRFFLPGADKLELTTTADVLRGDCEPLWIDNLVPTARRSRMPQAKPMISTMASAASVAHSRACATRTAALTLAA